MRHLFTAFSVHVPQLYVLSQGFEFELILFGIRSADQLSIACAVDELSVHFLRAVHPRICVRGTSTHRFPIMDGLVASMGLVGGGPTGPYSSPDNSSISGSSVDVFLSVAFRALGFSVQSTLKWPFLLHW